MTGHDEFRTAIALNPRDRVARGAYADFLEERDQHGDPDTLHALREHDGPVWVAEAEGKTHAGPRLSMADVRRIAVEKGSHWFDPDTMRFFGTRMGREVYNGPGGVFLVTSEQPPHGPRTYTVRRFDPSDATFSNAGGFGSHEAGASARRSARQFAAMSPTAAFVAMVNADGGSYVPRAMLSDHLKKHGLAADDETLQHLEQAQRVFATRLDNGSVMARPH